MPNWFSDGQAVENIPISDRGFQYGDGLFETIAIRNSEPRLWRFHWERLQRGCDKIGLAVPAENDLLSGIEHALHHGDVLPVYCTAKLIVTAGTGARGYGREIVASPRVLFGVFSSAPPAIPMYQDGIDTMLCQTRLAANSHTAGLKTLNRIEQVLARSELIESRSFEGLTMDTEDNIICGTMSNVFFVSKESISTPAVDRCGVAGVMRRNVLELLQTDGHPVALKQMPETALESVDEVFLCNSQFGILPVARCGELNWKVGNVTKSLMKLLGKAGIAECKL